MIAVLGTRGIPDVMGGVETHCQALYPRLAAKGPEECRTYEELQERAGRETVQSTMLASTAAALGRLDEAIGHLERADEERDPLLVMLARSWPWFDPLRSDARFTEIVGRLRLPRPIVAR